MGIHSHKEIDQQGQPTHVHTQPKPHDFDDVNFTHKRQYTARKKRTRPAPRRIPNTAHVPKKMPSFFFNLQMKVVSQKPLRKYNANTCK
jgi:hypothetical protein